MVVSVTTLGLGTLKGYTWPRYIKGVHMYTCMYLFMMAADIYQVHVPK